MQAVKKILFVCYGGGHVNMLIPVIKALQVDPQWEIHTLGLTIAGSVLKAAGIPYFGFHDLLDPRDTYTIQIGEKLAKQLSTGKVSHEESIAYLGMSYVDLEARLGRAKASTLFEQKGRHAFLPLTVMEKLFNKIKPDLIVTTNSPRAERAALLLAKEYHIPSICLIDLFDKAMIAWLAESHCANKICVLSQDVKNLLVHVEREKNDVLVTGNPAFDRLANKEMTKNAMLLRERKNWQNKKVILWASQPESNYHIVSGEKSKHPNLPRQIDQQLIKIIQDRKDLHLIIRLHPSEMVDYSNLPENVEIDNKNEDLTCLLAAVNLVITMTSTVGLEAVLLNTPLITVDMSVYSQDMSYADMGLALGVNHLDDLENAIDKVIYGDWRCEALLPQVGSATKAVVNIISSFFQTPPSSGVTVKTG